MSLADDYGDQALAVPEGDALLVVGPFGFTATGMTVQGEPAFEEWASLGPWLRAAHGAVQFWWGDWLRYGESRPDYQERLSQALGTSGYEAETLSNLKYVAENVAPSRRRAGLPFSVHAAVAPLTPSQQAETLDHAAAEEWTVSQTRAAVRAIRQAEGKPVKFWVLVECQSHDDLTEVLADMAAAGRPAQEWHR